MTVKNLLKGVVDQFVLSLDGPHGVFHWARVCENGRLLAPLTGATLEIVELFSIFHDAKRSNDGADPDHGRRSADYVRSLGQARLGLSERDFELLVMACARHSDGLMAGDVTVQTCWDADRLDISRVGIRLDSKRLCTEAARDPGTMKAAVLRSVTRYVPEWVADEWGVRDRMDV